MARSFVTTPIVDPVKAPISKRSLTHMNSAWDELGEDIIKGLLGTYTTNDVIVLYGCVVTANIPGTSSVTAGAIYYNGRIYKVDANASISSPSNTLVWSIATTYISGDPATFSDGSNANFHKIEKFQLTNAGTGTGLADYNAATVKDLWEQIDGVWVDASSLLANSYTVASGRVFQYKVTRSGQVTLRGALTSPGSGTSTQFISSFPASLRPTNSQQYTSCGTNSSGGNYLITVNSGGSCAVQNTTGGTAFIGTTEDFIVNCEWRIDE